MKLCTILLYPGWHLHQGCDRRMIGTIGRSHAALQGDQVILGTEDGPGWPLRAAQALGMLSIGSHLV